MLNPSCSYLVPVEPVDSVGIESSPHHTLWMPLNTITMTYVISHGFIVVINIKRMLSHVAIQVNYKMPRVTAFLIVCNMDI